MSVFRGVLQKIANRLKPNPIYQQLVSPANEELLEQIARVVQLNLSTAALHQKTFGRFKGIYTGKDVVVLATGPSSKTYKPIPGCAHIGVNHAFLREDVELDYIFTFDYGMKPLMKQLNAYRKGECIKFYGLWLEDDNELLIPESDAIESGALRFRNDVTHMVNNRSTQVRDCRFAYDLTTQPLGDFGSVIFSAMQFALWTNPRRIYIVGCDCSSGGHFFDATHPEASGDTSTYNRMIPSWVKLKDFAHRFYPDTEIISVNPVGLKGLFSEIAM